jgi:hypothetical protein
MHAEDARSDLSMLGGGAEDDDADGETLMPSLEPSKRLRVSPLNRPSAVDVEAAHEKAKAAVRALLQDS